MSESVQVIPPFVDAPVTYARGRRRAARPTAREWGRHTTLFLLTAMTATLAGIMLVGPEPSASALGIHEPASAGIGYLIYIPRYYLALTGFYIQLAFAQPALLAQGLTFAGSLLAILTAHESGHYIACRRYGVDATLPFFIPAPPLFLAGTFGAFIKIKSPIPSRRALFDIGLAGPLAGFVVALPIAVAGVLTMQPALPVTSDFSVVFNDPLLFRLIARGLGVQLLETSPLNPFYMAAWIGVLVTSLNLMPVGQLDGGHATYALFGARAHMWLGRVAFVTMSALAVLGWMWHGSPSGFLYAVLLAVMLRVRHPQTGEHEPLGGARIIVALITLLVFILSFLPFPIKIT
ncbi:MAG TPA: site-2 protease family protein [Pyrinomonadaceae bacterium]|nr:site-2 protease family protein [Pyrinomonadaceae bacterium]